MSRRIRVLLTFAFAISLGGLGLAVAQSGGDADAGDGASDEAGMDVERRANLTPEQQRQEAAEIVEKGNNVSRQVAAMLDEARQERDIIRVTCLNDKLTQINANLRTATTRAEALDDAVAAQDAPRRNHEFTVLTVIAQKLQTLEREAQQCIGEDIFETGATTVTTEIPDDPVDPDAVPIPPETVPVPVLPPFPS
ncbi:MAG: hypothetical protein JJ863_19655 [Deltaproteobacteria bacterium]|nr:hypothetical protein [Deltaproteobacteria bacterium]